MRVPKLSCTAPVACMHSTGPAIRPSQFSPPHLGLAAASHPLQRGEKNSCNKAWVRDPLVACHRSRWQRHRTWRGAPPSCWLRCMGEQAGAHWLFQADAADKTRLGASGAGSRVATSHPVPAHRSSARALHVLLRSCGQQSSCGHACMHSHGAHTHALSRARSGPMPGGRCRYEAAAAALREPPGFGAERVAVPPAAPPGPAGTGGEPGEQREVVGGAFDG